MGFDFDKGSDDFFKDVFGEKEEKPYDFDRILKEEIGLSKEDLQTYYAEMDSLVHEFRGPANEVVDFSELNRIGESHVGNLFDTSNYGASNYSDEYLEWRDNNIPEGNLYSDNAGDRRSRYYSDLFQKAKNKLDTRAEESGIFGGFGDPFIEYIEKYWYRPRNNPAPGQPDFTVTSLENSPWAVCEPGDPLGICDGGVMTPYKLASHLLDFAEDREINIFDRMNFNKSGDKKTLESFAYTYGGGGKKSGGNSLGSGAYMLFDDFHSDPSIEDTIIESLDSFHNIDLFKGDK